MQLNKMHVDTMVMSHVRLTLVSKDGLKALFSAQPRHGSMARGNQAIAEH
jgi:hypothetical protein